MQRPMMLKGTTTGHILQMHSQHTTNKFIKKDNTLFKINQEADKFLEVLVIPKHLAVTILVNSHNLQGYAGTNKHTP